MFKDQNSRQKMYITKNAFLPARDEQEYSPNLRTRSDSVFLLSDVIEMYGRNEKAFRTDFANPSKDLSFR